MFMFILLSDLTERSLKRGNFERTLVWSEATSSAL